MVGLFEVALCEAKVDRGLLGGSTDGKFAAGDANIKCGPMANVVMMILAVVEEDDNDNKDAA